MTSIVQVLLGLILALMLQIHVHAQSPREQLQEMVEQLQKAPNDNALRERIIKLGAEIKPAPGVPEEARRSFVEGINIVKLAKDAGSQKLAIGSFTEALKIAPWWGDAYYNLGVAQELAEQYDTAEQAFTFYPLSNPDATEQREVQACIYQLSAKRKLVGAQ